MKKANFYFFVLWLFGMTVVLSCEKSDIEYQNEFEKSYKTWLSFKQSSNNSYRYVVTGFSWVGSSWETAIDVTNGKITQRHFKYISPKGLKGNVPPEALEWTENESEINSHANSAAAETLTIDQIYDAARSQWLIKRKNAETYFEAKNNGLISSCGFVEDNCADDCFRGINIESIVKL